MNDNSIRTGLYGNTAKQILSYLLLNMRQNRISWSRRDRATAFTFKLANDFNGEILFVKKSYTELLKTDYNWMYRKTAFFNRNDIEARKWLSWQLKNLTRGLYGKDVWKRTNNQVLLCFKHEISNYWTNDAQLGFPETDVTVKMIYCLYDVLNARNKTSKRYDAKFIDSVVGVERDPFLTEQEKIRHDENIRIKSEADADIKRVRDEYDAKIEAFKRQINAECEEKLNVIRTKRDNDLKELNEAFDAATQLAD